MMRLGTTSLIVLLALRGAPLGAQSVTASCAGVQPPAAHAAAADSARLLALALQDAFEFPALSIAVAVDGEIVWSEAFGHADVESGIPACPATMFRIGSVSKTLTAAAAMKLREAGTIALDDAVQQYVPEFPTARGTITLKMLLAHLSGIRHYRDDEEVSNTAYDRLVDGISIFSQDPLEHEPGARFTYSSYGYNLLGAALERAAGQDFEALLRETVLGPIGMPHTRADRSDVRSPDRARFYERSTGGRLTNARDVDNSYKMPAGGLLSTPEDLARFGAALLEPGFLNRESLDLLFTSAVTASGTPTGYGLGWQVEPKPVRSSQAGHIGALVGGTAALLIDFERRVVVAFAANLQGGLPKPGSQPPPPPVFIELFAKARDRAGAHR